jgi:Flp pilus assembly protein TadD
MPGVSPEEARETAQRLLTSGRDAELLEFSESAVKQFPHDAELRMLYATALMKHGPEGASAQIEASIGLEPDHPWRLCRAASLSFFLGDFDASRAYLERAYRVGSEIPMLLRELIHLGGRLAAVAGDDELAEELLRSAFELEPDDLIFGRDLARFLAERGRIDEALIVIDRAQEFTIDTDELARLRNELR